MMKKVVVCLLAGLVVVLSAGCGSAASGPGEGGHLTIGITFDRPGMSLRNVDGSFSGFDVDVARYVANYMGVPPGNIEWKETPPFQREVMLQNRQVDMVVAAYSITDARKEKVSFAGPYFVAGQRLLVASGDNSVNGPNDLNGKRLCAPTGSAPAQNIKKNYAQNTQLQEYDTNVACIEALRNNAVDAVTSDDAILAGFAAGDPQRLRLAGPAFTTEKYGIGLNRHNDELRSRVNDAIEHFVADGSWQRAFDENLGVSGYRPLPVQPVDRYTTAADTSTSSRAVLAEYGGPVLAAFRTTIALTVSAAVVAVLLGLVLVVMRLSPVASLRRAGTIYVEIVRNTPLTLILLFCSFGLAQTLGLTMVDSTSSTSLADSAFRLSVLGLGAYTATFVCEVLRAGVNTVARGQSEAARALGLGFGRTLGLVILPQALRSVIGPLGTVLIALTKNSTIASIIGVAEASLLMKEMVENTGALLLVGAIIAIGFMCLTLPTGQLFEFLAKKYSVKS